jgi:SagB-type dehydrogenase family enzyme
MRLRRRYGLMCYWHDGAFVVHGYPRMSPAKMDPIVAEILAAFDDWIELQEGVEKLAGFDPDSVLQAITGLRQSRLLLAEGSEDADEDEAVARQWGPWAPESSFFHYATQDECYTRADLSGFPFDPTTADDEQAELDHTGDGRTHTLFTAYPNADRLLLPRRPTQLTKPLGDVLYSRRTHREFTETAVPLETLSILLATVFGPVDFVNSGRSALMRRTSAAGGSRQELDAYVCARNVEGVQPGIYHYNCLEHSLELLTEGLTRERVVELCGMQDWAGDTAFLVVLSAGIDRMLSKYRSPRAYRVCLLNAGHLGQTFALTATALGLGPFQTAAFHDSTVAQACGLDNIGHTPLYILAAGYPESEPRLAPPVASLETFRRTVVRQ